MIKYLLIAIALLAGPAFAEYNVNRSSYISGPTQVACLQATAVDKIFVGATTSAGVLVVYNSSWTTSAPVLSSITLSAGNIADFGDGTRVAGLCYQAVTPTNGVNIIYRK